MEALFINLIRFRRQVRLRICIKTNFAVFFPMVLLACSRAVVRRLAPPTYLEILRHVVLSTVAVCACPVHGHRVADALALFSPSDGGLCRRFLATCVLAATKRSCAKKRGNVWIIVRHDHEAAFVSLHNSNDWAFATNANKRLVGLPDFSRREMLQCAMPLFACFWIDVDNCCDALPDLPFGRHEQDGQFIPHSTLWCS
jgi:hypothetical protein